MTVPNVLKTKPISKSMNSSIEFRPNETIMVEFDCFDQILDHDVATKAAWVAEQAHFGLLSRTKKLAVSCFTSQI